MTDEVTQRSQQRPKQTLKTVAGALLAAISFGIPAANAAPPMPEALSALQAPIDASYRLPGTTMTMVRSGTEEYLLSGNGRYIFRGVLWDLWHGQQVNLEQAQRFGDQLDRERLNLQPEDIGGLIWGTRSGAGESNPQTLLVFLDPLDQNTDALMSALASVAEHQNLAVILSPVSGTASTDAAIRMVCHPNNAEALEALRNQSWDQLPEPEPDCDRSGLMKSLIALQLIGSSPPTMLTAEGQLVHGASAITSWIEQRQSTQADDLPPTAVPSTAQDAPKQAPGQEISIPQFALAWGTGTDLLVFVSPDCVHCRNLLDRIEREQWTNHFRFHLIPVASANASQATKQQLNNYYCALESDPDGARTALLQHDLQRLPTPTSGPCTYDGQQISQVTPALYGVDRVPYLITLQGMRVTGGFADMDALITQRSSQE